MQFPTRRRAVAGALGALLLALALLGGTACEEAEAPYVGGEGAPAATGGATSSVPAEPTASTGATPREQLPIVEFIRRDGLVVRLPTEVPPPSEYGIGLSGRRTLEERGMLFYMADPPNASPFWMKNTHINLSIAFVSTDMVVLDIREMQAESESLVHPGRPYQYAIEAPSGWYAARGVQAGDRMRLTFELPPSVRGR